jgi:hypothetical protein
VVLIRFEGDVFWLIGVCSALQILTSDAIASWQVLYPSLSSISQPRITTQVAKGGQTGPETCLFGGIVGLWQSGYSWRDFEGCLLMNTEPSLMAVSVNDEVVRRRSGGDRRESNDRRRGFCGRRGLFEYRADRECEGMDRRRRDRREDTGRSWWSFWRRNF